MEAQEEPVEAPREAVSDTRTLLETGDACLAAEQWADAIAAYERAGLLYSEQGQSLKEIAVYRRICEIVRRHAPDLQGGAGRVATRLGRTAARMCLDRGGPADPYTALAQLRNCFGADPRDQETLALLARAFDAIGHPAKAVLVLKEAARVARHTGETDRLDALVEALLARAPDDEEVRELARRASAAAPVAARLPPEDSEVGVAVGEASVSSATLEALDDEAGIAVAETSVSSATLEALASLEEPAASPEVSAPEEPAAPHVPAPSSPPLPIAPPAAPAPPVPAAPPAAPTPPVPPKRPLARPALRRGLVSAFAGGLAGAALALALPGRATPAPARPLAAALGTATGSARPAPALPHPQATSRPSDRAAALRSPLADPEVREIPIVPAKVSDVAGLRDALDTIYGARDAAPTRSQPLRDGLSSLRADRR
jgi:hypothetical protein